MESNTCVKAEIAAEPSLQKKLKSSHFIENQLSHINSGISSSFLNETLPQGQLGLHFNTNGMSLNDRGIQAQGMYCVVNQQPTSMNVVNTSTTVHTPVIIMSMNNLREFETPANNLTTTGFSDYSAPTGQIFNNRQFNNYPSFNFQPPLNEQSYNRPNIMQTTLTNNTFNPQCQQQQQSFAIQSQQSSQYNQAPGVYIIPGFNGNYLTMPQNYVAYNPNTKPFDYTLNLPNQRSIVTKP
jgi:hypothetical protein